MPVSFGEEKEFLYLYHYNPRPLINFLRDRYQQDEEKLQRILADRVRVNGVWVPGETLLQKGDAISYTHRRSDEKVVPPPLQVIYEDDDLLAISKPANLPVTPSGNYYFNSLAIHCKEVFHNPSLNPLHRLDLETSGVLAFGKHKAANRLFQPMFAEKRMKKRYQALVFGAPPLGLIEGDLVEDPASQIHSKRFLRQVPHPTSQSIIHEVLPQGPYSLVTLEPVTGKTNQLRVHLAALGCPIVGDKKYYPDESVYLDWYEHHDLSRILDRVKLPRQALHCSSLRFEHPLTGQWIEIHDNLDLSQWQLQ